MARPEAILCGKLIKRLREIPNTYWERIEQRSIRGTSDIIGCFFGQAYWIEVKTLFKERLETRERLQFFKHGEIIKAGGAVILITQDNWKYHCERLEMKAKWMKKS